MNMKKNSRRVLLAILACTLVFAMSVGALAANVVGNTSATDTPTVTLSDSGNHAVFTLNRQNTDLFDNFKSVMPGDTLTQTVTVKSQAGNSSNYNIYLYAREGAASSGDTTLPNQSEFLKQLKITVTIEGRTADLVAAGTGTAGVNLGQFVKSGATKDILVTLEVPITMGNEFANANANLDWFFYAQGIEDGSTGGGSTGGGGSGGGSGGGNSGGSTGGGTVGGNETLPPPPTVDITDPEVPLGNVDLGDGKDKDPEQVEITDPEVPLAALSLVSDIPQTGDENHMLLWGAVSVLSGGMLVFLLTGMKKKSNE